MNNPKRNTTVVTSGWNRCFEHVFPLGKKKLVDANHLPRESAAVLLATIDQVDLLASAHCVCSETKIYLLKGKHYLSKV